MKGFLISAFIIITVFSNTVSAKYTDYEKNILKQISECKWNSDIDRFKRSSDENAYIASIEYFSNCNVYKTPGVAYEWGRLVFPDVVPYLVKKATKENDSNSQYQLGEVYMFGAKGVPKDYKKALKWYKKSADQGDAKSQFKLGTMYDFDTSGVYKDYERSLKWYKKSAEQGNSKAQFNLGVLYENGKHIKQNYKESIKWYKLAIEQNLPEAKQNLGNMYLMFGNVFTGSGSTSDDHKQAVKWYKLSAKQDNLDAYIALGVLYAEGMGVDKDMLKAKKFFRKVYQDGSALKREKAEELLIKYDSSVY